MKHGDAAVELGLHIGGTGGREDYLPQLFVLLANCSPCERYGDQAGSKQGSSRFLVHCKSPLASGCAASEIPPAGRYGSVYSSGCRFWCAQVSSEGLTMRQTHRSKPLLSLMFSPPE